MASSWGVWTGAAWASAQEKSSPPIVLLLCTEQKSTKLCHRASILQSIYALTILRQHGIMEFAPAYLIASSLKKKKIYLKKCHFFYSVDVLPVTSKQPTMMYPNISSSFTNSSVHHNSTSSAAAADSTLRSSSNEDPTTDPTGVYSILKSRELISSSFSHVSTFMHLINGNACRFFNLIQK